ncbi:GNAT family N-acetyltransferase [Cerasibacillus sp. JNUCC 74]
MHHLTLKPIDKNNWEEAIHLNVKAKQQPFIASNLYSIAEVQFLDDFVAKGIYLDHKMIGFAMFGIDPDDHQYWIYRLMIDATYQGKGLGAQAVQLIIEELRQNKQANIPYVMIGYHPENLAAKFVYQKAGFKETELAPWGEQLASLRL